MRILVGIVGERQEHVDAADIASLPMRMGGLGLRRATRMVPAAYLVRLGGPQQSYPAEGQVSGVPQACGGCQQVRGVPRVH